MSSFEFILVSIAILVGFGISEILGGWGRQIRHRHEVRSYLLQVVASAWLLSLSLRYLWMLWTLQSVEWTYAAFLLVALPALVLALTAHLIRVETESLRRTPREQYFESAPPFYGLLAVFPLFSMANAVYHADHIQALFATAAGPFLLVWPSTIAVCVWLALSRKPGHHWIGLAVLWAETLMLWLRVLTTLDVAR
jgi:hypothetical protein